MGSRDRPSREAKKKPKDRSVVPKVQPLAEPPMNVELIRKAAQAALGRGEHGRRLIGHAGLRAPAWNWGSDRSRSVTMAVMERNGEKAVAERGKAVDAAILSIEKQFGSGSIMRLGATERQQVDFIPTGSIALDLALGVGGVPRGRITEIFGPESSGKTTVCQHIIAEAQRKGGVAAFIDVEHALDPGLRPRVRRQRR